MHIAFKINDERLILQYLDNGGSLNIKNNLGLTPLAYGSKPVLEKLGLEEGIVNGGEEEYITTTDNNKLLTINNTRKQQDILNEEL